ncbi:MAG: hypothetical protein HMLKMBBP_03653 [Planctomycetes bacterium]|nr:hypothetical protein [Planctomycetota bacterium]
MRARFRARRSRASIRRTARPRPARSRCPLRERYQAAGRSGCRGRCRGCGRRGRVEVNADLMERCCESGEEALSSFREPSPWVRRAPTRRSTPPSQPIRRPSSTTPWGYGQQPDMHARESWRCRREGSSRRHAAPSADDARRAGVFESSRAVPIGTLANLAPLICPIGTGTSSQRVNSVPSILPVVGSMRTSMPERLTRVTSLPCLWTPTYGERPWGNSRGSTRHTTRPRTSTPYTFSGRCSTPVGSRTTTKMPSASATSIGPGVNGTSIVPWIRIELGRSSNLISFLRWSAIVSGPQCSACRTQTPAEVHRRSCQRRRFQRRSPLESLPPGSR